MFYSEALWLPPSEGHLGTLSVSRFPVAVQGHIIYQSIRLDEASQNLVSDFNYLFSFTFYGPKTLQFAYCRYWKEWACNEAVKAPPRQPPLQLERPCRTFASPVCRRHCLALLTYPLQSPQCPSKSVPFGCFWFNPNQCLGLGWHEVSSLPATTFHSLNLFCLG